MSWLVGILKKEFQPAAKAFFARDDFVIFFSFQFGFWILDFEL